MDGVFLNAPEPSQNIHSENSNASAGRYAGKRLLRARFPMRKAVAADYNRDQACDLGDGSGEEGLNGGKAGVEGSAARLSVRGDWGDEKKRH